MSLAVSGLLIVVGHQLRVIGGRVMSTALLECEMEQRIPVDFGCVRGNLNCPKHGDQAGGFVIRVDSYPELEKVREVIFCGHCLLDALESLTHPVREII
jgi:hypothetical protein